jgi:biotin--protein ligase
MLEENDQTSGVRQIPLTIQGLTDSGYLLATDTYGTKFELHPDGNRYDCSNPQTQ